MSAQPRTPKNRQPHSMPTAVADALEARQLLATLALDPSFGPDGRVYRPAGVPDEIAVHANGKISVLADDGVMGGVHLTRLNPNGTRDTSFAHGIDGDHHEATDIEAAGDKLLVGAANFIVSSHMNEQWLSGAAIFKLNANGSIDTSFGTDGRAFMPDTDGGGRGVVDMLIQGDGKILALADTSVRDEVSGVLWPHYSVARFNPNGTIDTSFGGGDGVVHVESGGRGGSSVQLAIQPTTGEAVVLGSILFNTGQGLQLTRLNADGSIDTSYGGAFEPFSGHPGAHPTSLDFQSTGAAIVTGAYNSSASDDQGGNPPFGYVVRFNAQGDPDNSLKRLTDRLELEEVRVLPDDSLLIAGTTDGGVTPRTRRAAVWSVGPNGQNDTLTRTGWNTSSRGLHIDLQPDGKVLLAGYGMSSSYGAPTTLGLARFTTQSTPTGQTPFKGVPFTANQTVEFEDFANGGPGVSFSDTSSGNAGNAYRTSQDVDIYAVAGASNSHVVGLTRPGEWMEYTFNITEAGAYSFATRLASVAPGAFHYEVDGVNVTGSRAIPNTGFYSTYTTVNSPQFNLSAGTHVIRVMIDSTGAVGTAANLDSFRLNRQTTTPTQTPFKGTPFLPDQLIQAEDFDNGGQNVSFLDTTTANEGGAYRNTAVDLYAVSGASNGHVIGLTRPSEWLEYTVNVAESGTYSFDTRYATPATTAQYQYQVDGLNVTPVLNFTRTGSYETYATARTPTFTLSAGTHVIRLNIGNTNAPGTAANIDWLRVNRHSTTPPPTGQTPFNGTPFSPEQMIEAEDFDNGGQNVSFLDTSSANEGGTYRTNTAVDIYAVGGVSNGHVVGMTRPSEWIEYTINVPEAGTYSFDTRYATPATTALYQYQIDGVNVTSVQALPDTGSYAEYATARTSGFNLSAGTHIVRLNIGNTNAPGTAFNIDWIRLNRMTTTPPAQAPFSGTPFAVNATIQAEDYDRGGQGVAYSDLESANKGGQYRTSEGVDVEITGDAGGGFNVGYTTPNEWIEYTVNVPATGNYDVQTRLAAVQFGQISYAVDGVRRAIVNVVPTAGFQSYQTVTHNLGTLSAGTHVLRLQFETTTGPRGIANVNWLKVVPATTPAADTQAPSAVPRVRLFSDENLGVTFHRIEWSGARDNVGVAAYRVSYDYIDDHDDDGDYNDVRPISGTVGADARFVETSTRNTGHIDNLRVVAIDAAGNVGPATGIAPPVPTGLTGTYFNNADFTAPAFTRIDPATNFDWGAGSPDPRIDPDTFSVRWTGQIRAEGPYFGRRFWVPEGERARLIIDGQTIIDYIPGQTLNTGGIDLVHGHHTLVYETTEQSGAAAAALEWDDSGPRAPVPQDRFLSD